MIYEEKNETRKRKQTETRGECGTLSAPPVFFPDVCLPLYSPYFLAFCFIVYPDSFGCKSGNFPFPGKKLPEDASFRSEEKDFSDIWGAEVSLSAGRMKMHAAPGSRPEIFFRRCWEQMSGIRIVCCLLFAVYCLRKRGWDSNGFFFIYASLIYFFFI